MKNKKNIRILVEEDLERMIRKMEILEMRDKRLIKMKKLGEKILIEGLETEELEKLEREIEDLKQQVILLEAESTILS